METVAQSRPRGFSIKSSWFILAGLLVLVAAGAWRFRENRSGPVLFEPPVGAIQSEPLCPWRDPGQDLKRFFPEAARYEVQTRILSGLRLQLTPQLGRAPTGDENALHIYRIYAEQTPLGVVLTRRVKGGYGAIELVLAVGPEGRVRGVRIQRLREPEDIATALEQPEWLGAFVGKAADNGWRLGADLPQVPPAVRQSAEAIVQGVRSSLILLAAANQAPDGLIAVHH